MPRYTDSQTHRHTDTQIRRTLMQRYTIHTRNALGLTAHTGRYDLLYSALPSGPSAQTNAKRVFCQVVGPDKAVRLLRNIRFSYEYGRVKTYACDSSPYAAYVESASCLSRPLLIKKWRKTTEGTSRVFPPHVRTYTDSTNHLRTFHFLHRTIQRCKRQFRAQRHVFFAGL